MKFSFKSFIFGAILATIGTSTAFAASNFTAFFNSNKVVFDGKELDLKGQQLLSVTKSGEKYASNYMPIRGVFEAMGYNVVFDSKEGAVNILTENPAESSANETDISDVTLTVKEGSLSPAGLTLIWKNASNDNCYYGTAFSLEKMNGGSWEKVEISLKENYAFTSQAINLDANSSNEDDIKWDWLYGNLPDGNYRIIKDYIADNVGTSKTNNVSAEFEIKAQ